MGLIHIYHGDGKGKTSAAIGQAVRFAGRGGHAVIARFLKNDDSGEVSALGKLDNVTVLPCERSFGFTWQMTEEEKREAADYYRGLLENAVEAAVRCCRDHKDAPLTVLLVLDELCGAIRSGLVPEDEVLGFLDRRRPGNLEVVITGRGPSQALLSRGDYVTEMRMEKHPYTAGITARRGIEY